MPPETEVALSGTGVGLIFCAPPDENGLRDMWSSVVFYSDGSFWFDDYRLKSK